MASSFAVGNEVKIDERGSGTILCEIVKDGVKMYRVGITGIDYEADLPAERLQIITKTQEAPVSVVSSASAKSKPRFVPVCGADVDSIIINQANKSTLSKTFYDNKLLETYLKSTGETRAIHDIPPGELCEMICKFLISVRKSDGTNYEPSSLRGFICSFDRQLRRHNYPRSLISSVEFARLREVLKSKQMELKREGKGSKPNKSEPLSDEELEMLWQSGQLGVNTPDSIINTLWLYNTIHFGLRGSDEHRNMCWGDIILKVDTEGHEYLEFSERQTKTRTGANPRDVRAIMPKMWENSRDPTRCPVAVYKCYSQKRPPMYSDPHSPFYIATNTKKCPHPEESWFVRQPIGVNKLSSLMNRMCNAAQLPTTKKLSNHSARKYLVQKLNNENVPPTHIMQISGHKNIQSVNNYSHINNKQHKNISMTLHGNNHNDTAYPPVPSTTVTTTPTTMPPIHNILSQNATNSATSTYSDSSSKTVSVHGGFHTLFGGPIYGGNITINIHDRNNKRRRPIVESDSD